jgi:hypothetical protein
MRNVNTIALASLIIVSVGTFLIGQRLDARWAGGQGRTEHCPATKLDGSGSSISRGEHMSTAPDEYAKYQFCDGTILYLDTNTQIRLSQYRDTRTSTIAETQLELIQGRVIVDGLADVRSRNVTVSMTGAGCELVHYSWLDELDITPFVDSACKIKTPAFTPEALQTSRFNTFNASLINTTSFDPSTSTAKSFYEWTELSF